MPIADIPTFQEQSPTTPASQFALRILVEGNNITPDPIGTAVWVCGHLVLTARHNIEYIQRKYSQDGVKDGIHEVSNYAIRLYQILPGPDYAIWEVRSISCSPMSDLALMHVVLWGYSSEQPPNPAFGLSMRGLPPDVGAKIAGFGYHSIQAVATPKENSNDYHLDLNDVPQATTGLVTAVFPERRDSAMYNFPCFQVNARFDAGMSGGPVFNEQGQLIGIISGNLPADENAEDVSYVASIWPMLRILIDFKKAGQPQPTERYPAIDLALEGLLHVADLRQLNPTWFPGRTLT